MFVIPKRCSGPPAAAVDVDFNLVKNTCADVVLVAHAGLWKY